MERAVRGALALVENIEYAQARWESACKPESESRRGLLSSASWLTSATRRASRLPLAKRRTWRRGYNPSPSLIAVVIAHEHAGRLTGSLFE